MMTAEIQIQPLHSSQILPFDWGELTWYANRQIGNCEEITVGKCVLKPRQSNPRHYHPNCAEVLIVIKGHVYHTSGPGQEQEMNEGDTVTIPPNVWHCARNIGAEEAVLFIAFTSADRLTVGE